jgi:hypothetical protein
VHTMITLRRPGFPALQLQLTPPHSQPYIVKLSSKAHHGDGPAVNDGLCRLFISEPAPGLTRTRPNRGGDHHQHQA